MRNELYIPSGFLFFFILFLGACESRIKLPPAGEPKILMLGEMVAGDSIWFRAGQSIPVKSGTELYSGLLYDLDITIEEESGNIISLREYEDELSASVFTFAFSAANIISSDKTYKIKASHKKLGTATASVQIPQPFTAAVTDTTGITFRDEDCIKINVQFQDEPGKQYYVLEVLQQPYTIEPSFFFDGSWLRVSDHFEIYDSLQNAGVDPQERNDTFSLHMFNRIHFYTDDLVSEHLLNGNGNVQARRLLLNDLSFNGNTHAASLIIPRGNFGQQFPGINMRTLICVKSITAEYFRFLQGYEQSDPFMGFSNTINPIRVDGNVNNGMGMIGGVYLREFVYHF